LELNLPKNVREKKRRVADDAVAAITASKAQAPIDGRVRTMGQRVPKASELLAQEIASEIIAEARAPGDRLPLESEMIKQYGVGRSTVREALRILEVSGLITMRSGRHGGPMVGDCGPANLGRIVSLFMHANGVSLGEIIRARALLEPCLLRAAIDSADEEFIARAADLKKRSRECDPLKTTEYRLLTREFHELIASAAGNRPIGLLAMALMFLTRLDHSVTTLAHRRGDVIAEHEEVLDAIIDRDGERAEALMVEHMKAFCESVEAHQPQDYNKIVNWRWS
jgi:DNA-binding FadR family transcriptional regulator